MSTFYNEITEVFTFPWTALDLALFSNAERTEDEVQDVFGCGRAGYVVQWTQGTVEVEQDHLVWRLQRHGLGGAVERRDSVGHQHLLADIGQKSCLLLGTIPMYPFENHGLQLRDAFASQGRREDCRSLVIARQAARN